MEVSFFVNSYTIIFHPAPQKALTDFNSTRNNSICLSRYGRRPYCTAVIGSSVCLILTLRQSTQRLSKWNSRSLEARRYEFLYNKIARLGFFGIFCCIFRYS